MEACALLEDTWVEECSWRSGGLEGAHGLGGNVEAFDAV